jgi:hypothetical protein
MATYSTLYDYYTKGLGKPLPSLSERAKLYEQYGLGKASQYTGTAEQNIALLNKLQSQTQPQQPSVSQVQQPASQTQAWQPPAGYEYISGPSKLPLYKDIITEPGTINKWGIPINQSNQQPPPTIPQTPTVLTIPDFDTTSNQLSKQISFQDYLKQLQEALPAKPATSPSLVDEYKRLREEAGIENLEAELEEVNKQIKELNNRYLAAKQEIESSPISKFSASAKLSKLQRDLAAEYAPLQERQTYLADQLKTKNATIETLMNLTNKDYERAKEDYENEYNRVLKLYDIFRGEEERAATLEEKAQDNARANLQIIANQMISGNISWDQLDDIQKAKIQQIELRAGFPIGYLSTITKTLKPKEDIVATSTFTDQSGNKIVSVITRMPTGGFETKNIILGKEQRLSDKDILSIVLSQDDPNAAWETLKNFLGIGGVGTTETTTSSELSRAERNNNPLNIKYGSLTSKWVKEGKAEIDPVPATDGGYFLKFKDAQTGLQAAIDLLKSDLYINKTVDAALRLWSNNGYGGEIVPELKNKTIKSLTSSELNTLIQKMIQVESGSKSSVIDLTSLKKKQEAQKLTPTQIEHLNDYETARSNMQEILNQMKQYQFKTGPLQPMSWKFLGIGELFTQLFGSKEFAAFKSAVNRAFQSYRKLVTGAQASDKELARLEPNLPKVTDRPDIFIEKAQQLINEYDRLKNLYLEDLKRGGYDISAYSNVSYLKSNISDLNFKF